MMATAVILPKLGNSVESSIIVRWHVVPGTVVATGQPLCEVETDKTTMEVPSPADGVLLHQFFAEGDDVAVLATIALIGAPGEEVGMVQPGPQTPGAISAVAAPVVPPAPTVALRSTLAISPRARKLAAAQGIDPHTLQGSGPGGRIIERDLQAAHKAQPRMTPLARTMLARGSYTAPMVGSGPGQRISARDLQPASVPTLDSHTTHIVDTKDTQENVLPVTGVRKLIAQRMLASLQSTAQLTLNRTADARQLQQFRQRLKTSPEALGLRGVTINDLLVFAVARSLLQHPELNATYSDLTITRFQSVHLGVAVDTPRGLMVPVICNAHTRSLRDLSQETARLVAACQAGQATPEELHGGTFTITNLGSLGIDSFTPILNPPQVAILGVGGIALKPVETDGGVSFLPHINLSLTIDHQVIDGAPAARFLQTLAGLLAAIDLVAAVG